MEFKCRPRNRQYCYQEEGMEELRHSLVYTNFELESTILSAKGEITRREYELVQLEFLLSKTIKERDEAQANFQKLTRDKLVLQQQLKQNQQRKKQEVQPNQVDATTLSRTDNIKDESSKDAAGFNKQNSPRDCHNCAMVTTSPAADPSLESPILLQEGLGLLGGKSLPEKGKLLQAVVDAGPLLQTLLLAGPLPQWQHPPPPLVSAEIFPVAIYSPVSCLIHQESFNSTSNTTFSGKKRAIEQPHGDPDSYSSPNKKYPKVALQ